MQLKDFDYPLPEELIAKFPSKDRTESRLLCLDSVLGNLQHKKFYDIYSLLEDGDLLVMNDTKVIPARLYGIKDTGGKIEILIEQILEGNTALAQIRASKAPKLGSKLAVTEDNIVVTVQQRQENLFLIKFPTDILNILNRKGHIPLPPYMQRQAVESDISRYQTVYAAKDGAVAAPTAGLHFDNKLLQKLNDKGVNNCFVTLHVGAGTYQPVRTDTIEEHTMHSEYIEVSQEICDLINKTKQRGKRVIAVGTTVVRSLESASSSGTIQPFQGRSALFIYPGYTFNTIDALITNFHFPQSTLLMLVSAFAGKENILHSYDEAIANKYRFFSYGDAMFIKNRKNS
jgi:S-adenosylmethionine:tRNA ribosyltransferase-isomerase